MFKTSVLAAAAIGLTQLAPGVLADKYFSNPGHCVSGAVNHNVVFTDLTAKGDQPQDYTDKVAVALYQGQASTATPTCDQPEVVQATSTYGYDIKIMKGGVTDHVSSYTYGSSGHPVPDPVYVEAILDYKGALKIYVRGWGDIAGNFKVCQTGFTTNDQSLFTGTILKGDC